MIIFEVTKLEAEPDGLLLSDVVLDDNIYVRYKNMAVRRAT
jgi:hypothetical protein